MSAWSEASRGFGGRVEEFPLTSILQILELGRKTGFLYLRQYPHVAFLVFEEGGIVQAVSSARRAGLGELLIEAGYISRDDLTHALEIQERAPKTKMLGEIFETLGHITHDQIIAVLTKQMKDVVRWILHWEEGEYTFYAGEDAKPNLLPEEKELILPVGLMVDEVLKEMITETDRRKAERVPLSLKIVMKTPEGEFSLFTQNVSSTGALILSSNLPPIGDPYSFELWIPTFMDPVSIEAEVVRHVEEGGVHGFAIHFSKIEEEARELLGRLSQTLSRALD